MIKDPDARRRASFGRAARLRKEAAAPAQKAERKAAPAQRASRQQKPAQRRQEFTRKAQPRKHEQRRKEPVREAFNRQAKTDAQRKAEQQRLERLAVVRKRIDEYNRRAAQRREREAKERVQREFNRKADERKAADRKAADRKAAERSEAAKQEAQRKADERKAAAWVAQRQKQQQADAIAQQRYATSRLRTIHREETRSMKANETTAIERHAGAMKRIDAAEARALHEFGVKRRSLTGRATELVKGSRHFEKQRADIVNSHEAERMKWHRDLEGFKERHFTKSQDMRLKQARERKEIFDKHRDERREFARTQEAARPRMIEDRKQAFNRAAEIERSHKQERTQEREQARGLAR